MRFGSRCVCQTARVGYGMILVLLKGDRSGVFSIIADVGLTTRAGLWLVVNVKRVGGLVINSLIRSKKLFIQFFDSSALELLVNLI